MRISDWSSDVCSSDLRRDGEVDAALQIHRVHAGGHRLHAFAHDGVGQHGRGGGAVAGDVAGPGGHLAHHLGAHVLELVLQLDVLGDGHRSEEHTSELQSLMRISYAVFCLKQQNINITTSDYH